MTSFPSFYIYYMYGIMRSSQCNCTQPFWEKLHQTFDLIGSSLHAEVKLLNFASTWQSGNCVMTEGVCVYRHSNRLYTN
jgi:hypothetical protein